MRSYDFRSVTLEEKDAPKITRKILKLSWNLAKMLESTFLEIGCIAFLAGFLNSEYIISDSPGA